MSLPNSLPLCIMKSMCRSRRWRLTVCSSLIKLEWKLQVTNWWLNVSGKDHWKIKKGKCNAAKEIKEKGQAVISTLHSITSWGHTKKSRIGRERTGKRVLAGEPLRVVGSDTLHNEGRETDFSHSLMLSALSKDWGYRGAGRHRLSCGCTSSYEC